jgi:hypothetical protein
MKPYSGSFAILSFAQEVSEKMALDISCPRVENFQASTKDSEFDSLRPRICSLGVESNVIFE